MLDAHQLNVFLIAAETLNFTQAAARLHMTQPSVSQHIQALERHFDMELFVRTGRHIELSDAGLRLLPMARDLVNSSIMIEEMMESLKGEVYGHLQVGCSTTPGKYILPQLLAHYHKEHPKVRVTCTVTNQAESLRMLLENQTHIALTSLPQEDYRDIQFENFMVDHIVLIAPLDHPWALKETINPMELCEADLIVREPSSGTQIAVEAEMRKFGITLADLKVILTLGNSEAIALAVQEGLGVGFVSSMVINKLVYGKVASIKVEGFDVRRNIQIGRYINRPATAAQNAFWEYITGTRDKIEDNFIRPLTELQPM